MLVSHDTDNSFAKIYIDYLDEKILDDLILLLKEGIYYEIMLFNIEMVPFKLLMEFEKYKSHINIIVNEQNLRCSLLALGFTVEHTYFDQNKDIDSIKDINYVAIGGSAGSLKKMIELIGSLPKSEMTFFIVMHLQENSSNSLQTILQKHTTNYQVVMAEDNLQIQKSSIYIAQPSKHMLIKDGHIFFDDGKPRNFSKPSISTTFSSLSKEYKEKLLVILVCGYGADGSDVLKEVRENKGRVFIEHLAECIATPMLVHAINTLQYDKILSIREISLMFCEGIDKEERLKKKNNLLIKEIKDG